MLGIGLVGLIVSESYFAVHINLAIGNIKLLREMVKSVGRELWPRKIHVENSPPK